jgi:tetratricopeptide (TPR) repeat protein
MGLRGWALILAFCTFSSSSWAQFDQLVSPQQVPQARSQQELDDYIEILDANTAQEKVRRIETFFGIYPESELRGVAYQHLMLAFRDMGDYERLIQSGEKALKFQPDNLNTLLALADAIPNGVTGEGERARSRLAQAEEYARRIFEGIERMKLPRSVSPERWQTLRKEMEASAHEALGHIATKRGQLRAAVAEFEKAVEQNPRPRGSQFYRLGVAYMLAGKDQAAEVALLRAEELGPREIREMANTILESINLKKRNGNAGSSETSEGRLNDLHR